MIIVHISEKWTDQTPLKKKKDRKASLRSDSVENGLFCRFLKRENKRQNLRNQSQAELDTKIILCLLEPKQVSHCDLETQRSDTFGSERRKSTVPPLSGWPKSCSPAAESVGFSKHNFTGWRDHQSCSLKLSAVLMWWLMAADLQRARVELGVAKLGGRCLLARRRCATSPNCSRNRSLEAAELKWRERRASVHLGVAKSMKHHGDLLTAALRVQPSHRSSQENKQGQSKRR